MVVLCYPRWIFHFTFLSSLEGSSSLPDCCCFSCLSINRRRLMNTPYSLNSANLRMAASGAYWYEDIIRSTARTRKKDCRLRQWCPILAFVLCLYYWPGYTLKVFIPVWVYKGCFVVPWLRLSRLRGKIELLVTANKVFLFANLLWQVKIMTAATGDKQTTLNKLSKLSLSNSIVRYFFAPNVVRISTQFSTTSFLIASIARARCRGQ